MALFGGKTSQEAADLRAQLEAAHSTIGELRGWVTQLRGAGTPGMEADLRDLHEAVETERQQESSVRAQLDQLRAELTQAQSQLVETSEQALLQQVGIYEYAHPLDDALAYKDELAKLRTQIKMAAKGDAVTCQVDWQVNGSVKEGQKLGRDIAKLMLRAYNNEADNAVRAVKPHTRDKTKERLTKTRDTIAKLGALLHVNISPSYHRLRLKEIDLTADYLVKVEVEKEEARAERERLREEAKVAKEIERERAKLAKERAHYESVVARLTQSGDSDAMAKAQQQLAEVDDALAGVEARAANIRAGYVYVVSNLGAFGADVVKIGLTRRLDPMDRIRELGDASVPFRFDCHALFFSEDAVALENALHTKFADRRVNLVNMRREFFYVTPAEVRDALVALGDDHILDYTETAEAVEWRASDPSRRIGGPVTDPSLIPPEASAAYQASGGSVGDDGDLSDDGQG